MPPGDASKSGTPQLTAKRSPSISRLLRKPLRRWSPASSNLDRRTWSSDSITTSSGISTLSIDYHRPDWESRSLDSQPTMSERKEEGSCPSLHRAYPLRKDHPRFSCLETPSTRSTTQMELGGVLRKRARSASQRSRTRIVWPSAFYSVRSASWRRYGDSQDLQTFNAIRPLSSAPPPARRSQRGASRTAGR